LTKSRRRRQPSDEVKNDALFKVYQTSATMSALGQKQTYALQKAMSALLLISTEKADIAS
jgi:hypothetical protein